MRRTLALASALACSACAAGARARALPPLAQEAEVFVYLEPLERDARRIAFAVATLAAERADGPPVPLEVTLRDVQGASAPRQRLLAWGRLPPGDYPALLLGVGGAKLSDAEGGPPADLLAGEAPVRVPVPLQLRAGQAAVLSLSLQFGASVVKGFAFEPSFTAAVPVHALPQLAIYAPNQGQADVAVLDRHARRATGAVAAGLEPAGAAVDAGRLRLYLALAGEDQVQVLDLLTGVELQRILLRAGDRPRELRLTDDGQLLLCTNPGSNTVSFLDPGEALEVARVAVGEEPTALLLDRGSRRAYVANRRGSSVSVLDLASRSVAGTFGTDPLPARLQLDRLGRRLYVAQSGSPYLSVLTLPSLALERRVYVGLGAAALKVDPRTDLVYVGREGDPAVQVFDPVAFLPVATVELPGGAAYLTIDDVENTLLALVPEAREVVFVDLVSRRAVGAVDVGADPAFLALTGERN